MIALVLIPSFLSALLLAAHFFRNAQLGFVLICCCLPWLLLARRMWAVRLLQIMLMIGALEWVRTLLQIRAERIDEGREWQRMAIILGAVGGWTALSALLLFFPLVRRTFGSVALRASHSSVA